MSTALAIAATTRVLAALIDENVSNVVNATFGLSQFLNGPDSTSASPPDHVLNGSPETTRLNLFLYQLSLNPGWREAGLPSRNSLGDSIDRPLLALDLHYMLTAYSPDDYKLEIMLGLGMQALHETPFLYRQKIRNVFTNPPPQQGDVNQVLGTANLADQIEIIKITPTAMSTEELSKIWTALQGKYRPSAAYMVSVVLIESAAPIRAALPVMMRNLAILPFQDPYIDAVSPQILPYAPSSQVTISGRNLSGQGVVVVFDGNPGAPQTPIMVSQGGASVTVALPPLEAGINAVHVVRQLAIGAPPVRKILESNVGTFILQPVIRSTPNAITLGAPFGGPPGPVFTPLTVLLDPVLATTQKVSLLLNAMSPPAIAAPRSYVFNADANAIAGNAVTFNITGVEPGQHLVRVRVDGAESPLLTDPATGAFNAPSVNL